MTSSDPGPGGQHDPAKAQETAQWWATPPTGTDPGQPVQGADPTMLNYAAGGGMAYTPPAQAVPQMPSDAGYPQQQPMTGGGYPQPMSGGYPQQQYAAPQQQYAAPQQQYAPVPPVAPAYGYAAPPPKGGNKTGWIIGGVVGLVVIVGAVIGIVALSSGSGPLNSDKKNAGKYTMDNVSNGCSVIDTSALSKFAANSKGTPEHSETKATDYSGGRFECRAGNEETTKPDKYGSTNTNTADLTLDVSFLSGTSSAYNRPEYDIWKTSDTGTTGSGRTSGDLGGIGEAGYWVSKSDDYTYFTTTDYTCAVKDDNASVKINIRTTMYKGKDVSRDDLAQVCKDQTRKALDNVKKK
ncbi:hypothetical protein GPX89_20625 [Nocardia sp. ET3-3]|uniref:DUF3558 domain-containing protein n=1 Tax=Nocardia terrae TaxID=2675851 RepID=A0A7K1UZP3_9NOCA|nr:hypothetical protein [Nocardia terrae]MVU79639.1 hypothetical protein [Nocardia terrae]